MHENYKGYEIHQAQIAPRDRVFVLLPGSACPEHDAPHFVSAAAARAVIDAGSMPAALGHEGARERNRGIVSP